MEDFHRGCSSAGGAEDAAACLLSAQVEGSQLGSTSMGSQVMMALVWLECVLVTSQTGSSEVL